MAENIYNKTRRNFIKLTSMGVFALHPTISALARWLKVDNTTVKKCFYNDEFHYFGNNLTNLHFYFINAKIEGKLLKKLPNTDKAFMVVKIPQQHVSEELIREQKFEDEYSNTSKRTESKISGFSFLSFRLFPTNVTVESQVKGRVTLTTKRQTFIDLSDINNLLNWNNSTIYELLIPVKEDYKEFTNVNWQDFEKNNETSVSDDESNPSQGYICSLYQNICKTVFKEASFPLTVLEIPEGLLASPYSENGKTLFADTYGIPKTRFVYNGSRGKVVRTVEEIWSTQLFFDTVEGHKSPPLRGVGYIPRKNTKPKRDNSDCPDEPITYLPTLLDKNEVVYLTSLGRGNNTAKEWNIETRGLTLTGLGAIAKFQYKNFNPPKGSDLAEYEHHFTLGRDEYIKVARIGVISVTGQKALHIKIGQRNIKNGISYMEFKEYIEIIQKDISYFDNNLFVKDEPNKKEPYNYIQARRYPPSSQKDGTIHSYDDIYDGDSNSNDANDVWIDKAIWNQNILPDKWNTHYKRWAFVKISSIKSVSPPIITLKNDVKPDTIIDCGECSPNNPFAFWPISETDKSDVYLDFKGLDWNNKEIHFSSTFLFIRKSLIETGLNDNCIKAIYENFSSKDRIERRQIRFVDSQVAYTSDYSNITGDKAELSNKSNVAKTDYIEYYFSLCKEPLGETLEFKANKIQPSGQNVQLESIFNERFFPLFPQVKRAQLYVENIQGYTSEPIPSIIEYNDEFINYGFERKKLVKGVEVVYNKARLIFNHTENFVKNTDKILDYVDGKWLERKSDGYRRIKQIFSGAGSAIGGLVNPDFDIQSIGLVKQSLAVGKQINKKYEQATEFTDKIEKFNPSDLLRQTPEIFNGISLIDILQEVFPDYEAPINDIKNVVSKIDTVKNELLDNPIYLEIKADLKYINDRVLRFQEIIEDLQRNIDNTQDEIKGLKDKFNREFLASEIEKLVSSEVSKCKITFLKEANSVANIANAKKDELLDYLTTELLSKAEAIYPYHQILNDSKVLLANMKTNAPGLTGIIETYIKDFINDTQYLLIDIGKVKKDEILIEYSKVKAGIDDLIKSSYDAYLAYSNALNEEIKTWDDYQTSIPQDMEAKYNMYLSKKLISLKASDEYKKIEHDLKRRNERTQKLIDELRKDEYRTEYEKIKHFEQDILKIQNSISYLNSIVDTVNIPHLVDTFNKSIQDIKTFESKLNNALLPSVRAAIDKDFKDNILSNRKTLEAHYKSKYDTDRKNFDKLISESETKLTQYLNSVGQESIDTVLNSIGLPDFRKLKDDILAKESEFKNKMQEQLRERVNYESFLKKQVDSAGKEIIELIKEKIDEKERDILNDPGNQELIYAFVKGKELLNILTSLSKKEINYTWQTSSFKNADFGIVSFLASSNPKTSLSVQVTNTTYFQPNRFPAVVQKVDFLAENRLNNFGISLLKAIIVNFNEVYFVAGTNQKQKFEVKIRDVQFAGAFSFVQALEGLFKKLLGDNFSVRIQPHKVDIEYLLPIPFIGAPSFGFRDILFRVLYTLHFTNRPMELGVGIGSPENKTKLSVGIYTGFFHFFVIGNPKQGITLIEVSIEFGGYFGLSLGPLRGEVKLAVGLYYRKDQTGVTIEGYFLVEGRVKLWFIMITARFYMGVKSQGGYVEGRCTVSYEIRLGRFFKRSFSASYYKKLAGAQPANNNSGSIQKAFETYEKVNGISVLSLGSLSVETETLKKHKRAFDEELAAPVERFVKPLTQTEWDTFINSYID
ncbi:hypothetical protein LZG74_11250 [Dyadobacter sp. CY327]|uniref:hypothetical protein n=1 Tax=Dyadobacter sp. CY327 TaxID=2907301 RepID=UPI001F22FADA|nr:hypothetical protein [Dyadobacter sp. CY327]MCE7070883.1 hypothetical protein [Dyadobacter sp. CY327]